jgi:hypothetical protein
VAGDRRQNQRRVDCYVPNLEHLVTIIAVVIECLRGE